MKSSNGQYFIGLDHIRAIAAFIVFTWHFIHVNNGHHAPPPAFPLSLLTEGHNGVSLFMVLSGYLFSKLLDNKSIIFKHFIWNRFLRLAPLLIVVIIVVGIEKHFQGRELLDYGRSIIFGLLKPSLPHGGWSITVEFHFYLILPGLLFLTNKWKFSLVLFLLAAITIRVILYQELGQIQFLSYWTLIGRVDQFILGILAFKYRKALTDKHILIMFNILTFSLFYWFFDNSGGFYSSQTYPSQNIIWIIMPTIEGLAYALIIAWYDTSFIHSTGKISKFIALIGTYSYSIYLLHFFVVFRMAREINNIIDLSNIHLALLFSALSFPIMIPIGFVSYRYIERPFLRYRTKYTLTEKS